MGEKCFFLAGCTSLLRRAKHAILMDGNPGIGNEGAQFLMKAFTHRLKTKLVGFDDDGEKNKVRPSTSFYVLLRPST